MKALLLALPLLLTLNAKAEVAQVTALDELDPFAPDIESQLEQMDEAYEATTGESAQLFSPISEGADCYQRSCNLFLNINKATQKAELFINGTLTYEWLVSTGTVGHGTPDFDKHPDGRIYNRYTSTKYPGGDYQGLGNMPYAVFIKGGFAVHGTGVSNWKKLGTRASHGCIRVHPDNAKIFNGLVRANGVANTWITVR